MTYTIEVFRIEVDASSLIFQPLFLGINIADSLRRVFPVKGVFKCFT